MAILTPDQKIKNIQQLIAEWDADAFMIDKVRRLEQPTAYTPHADRDEGYYRSPALIGYQRLLQAYQALDDTLTPAQQIKFDKILRIQDSLKRDYADLKEDPSDSAIRSFTRRKMAELEQNGEIYLLSGHKEHFNITRIKKAANGGYTYTLYDAGHESERIRVQDGRPIMNAVVEHHIRRGANVTDLVEADTRKKYSDADTPEYKTMKSRIENAIEKHPIRAEVAYGQRKGNCTTRGQRIMIADILQDDDISEKVYDFVSDVDKKDAGDIKKALQRKLSDLQRLQTHGYTPPRREMSIENFARASNPDNYQNCQITLDNGNKKAVYRTWPGVFSEDELQDMKDTLRRQGVEATVRESVTEPGKHYLYVRRDDAEQIGAALARDDSPAAAAYRARGENMAAAHRKMHENVRVDLGEANLTAVTRTVPNAYNHDELVALQDRLRAQNVPSLIKTSSSQNGEYLAVQREDAQYLLNLLSPPPPGQTLRDVLEEGARNGRLVSAGEAGAIGITGDQRMLDQIRRRLHEAGVASTMSTPYGVPLLKISPLVAAFKKNSLAGPQEITVNGYGTDGMPSEGARFSFSVASGGRNEIRQRAAPGTAQQVQSPPQP